MALGAHLVQLGVQRVKGRQRVGREAFQRHGRQQPPALRGRHLAQEQLARGRAMGRHARAWVQIKAQRRGRLHPVQVEHLAAREGGDVAALADIAHQLRQHRVARAMRGVVEQHAFGQPHQAPARAVVPSIALALQDARAFELLEHAVHGGLGQACLLDHGLQREGLVLLRNGLQQREQPQVGGIAIDTGRDRVSGVHGVGHHMFFNFSSQFIPKKEICLTSRRNHT